MTTEVGSAFNQTWLTSWETLVSNSGSFEQEESSGNMMRHSTFRTIGQLSSSAGSQFNDAQAEYVGKTVGLC